MSITKMLAKEEEANGNFDDYEQEDDDDEDGHSDKNSILNFWDCFSKYTTQIIKWT